VGWNTSRSAPWVLMDEVLKELAVRKRITAM
jgi:hypothetical protein